MWYNLRECKVLNDQFVQYRLNHYTPHISHDNFKDIFPSGENNILV